MSVDLRFKSSHPHQIGYCNDWIVRFDSIDSHLPPPGAPIENKRVLMWRAEQGERKAETKWAH